MSVVAIIPARGGSRGIPRKNLVEVCGKPLLAWSIEQALAARLVDAVHVSSDSEEILSVARAYGAHGIRRPAELAGDSATSESAWLHALQVLEVGGAHVDIVVGMQATSPIREARDIDAAIEQFRRDRLDSLLAACEVRDFFMWSLANGSGAASDNHDYRARKRRQDIEPKYLENGSFYLFTPELLKQTSLRLGGRIGMFVMPRYKMFQIDDSGDVALCEAVMRGYGVAR